ncbi:MAG: AAA family ATPase [Planctomycetota bacterium]|jgi:predicted ATPase
MGLRYRTVARNAPRIAAFRRRWKMLGNSEFLKVLGRARAKRARYFLCDLHVHTLASKDSCEGERYEKLSIEEKELVPDVSGDALAHQNALEKSGAVEIYYDLLVKRRDEVPALHALDEESDWAIVALTDHNTVGFASRVASHACVSGRLKKNRLVVLPGIELDVSYPVPHVENPVRAHIVLIYKPSTEVEHVYESIRSASGSTTWEFGHDDLTVDSLPNFVQGVRSSPANPAICVAAHVGSSRGVQGATKDELLKNALGTREAEISRIGGALLLAAEEGSDAESAHSREELEALLARLREERAKGSVVDEAQLKILELLGKCGFDALQVAHRSDERHYRRLHRFREGHGRAVPIVCSDAHSVGEVFVVEGTADPEVSGAPSGCSTPYLKLPGLSSAVTPDQMLTMVRDALRFGETRFSFAPPERPSMWIEGLMVSPQAEEGASSFWARAGSGSTEPDGDAPPFFLPFSPNLNCLVGGRGSGKSAVMEAIEFLANRPMDKDDFNAQAQKAPDEWDDFYRRTHATINGCQARLCWRSTKPEFSSLPKKALFVSRYFNPGGPHRAPTFGTCEGSEVLASELPEYPIQLYRIHEIEERASKPEKLRELFDHLCGDRIGLLTSSIESLRDELEAQREAIVEVARQINEIVAEGEPLDEYVARKQRFSHVNRPEVVEKYGTLDAVGKVQEAVTAAAERWSEVVEAADTGTLRASVNTFFEKLKDELTRDGAEEKADHKVQFVRFAETLRALLPDVEGGKRETHVKVLAVLDQLDEALSLVKRHLGDADKELVTLRGKAIGELGESPGASDRESKRASWEEAEASLEEYRALAQRFDGLMAARKARFEALKSQCKERTELRNETAHRITRVLSRDLDASILEVTADAQAMADKRRFGEWLDRYLMRSFGRYSDLRKEALFEKGLVPEALRDLLLGEVYSDSSLLVTPGRASDGGISAEAAERAISARKARIRLEAEATRRDLSISAEDRIPPEINEGLWSFPGDGERLDAALMLDEVVLDDLPIVKMKDRPEMTEPRPLQDLSPGQRCSAILPILLLTGECPLVIDQPEDNLDNRLIRQVIVNVLAAIKLRRQVIVATHNPNIPVLGDAECITALRAVEQDQAEVEAIGDLDQGKVVKAVTSIMEGGREAFQYRQSVYLPHWAGAIETG